MKLGGAKLCGAKLGGVKLGGAKLGGMKLGGVKLGAANLGAALLGAATLEGANEGAPVDRRVALGWESRVEDDTWYVARGGSCTSSRRQLTALLNLAHSSIMRL